MTQVIEALKWRYATKKFDNQRLIPDEKIEVIKEAFDLTATSFGLQPVRLAIVKNKEIQRALVTVSMNQEQIAQASHVLVFCREREIGTDYVNSYFDNVVQIRKTPEEILAPFKNYLLKTFENDTPESIALWATKQAYLAMGNLLTVCALEKIDACPMEGFSPEGYNEILGLEEKGLDAVLVMPVGYRADDDMFASFKKVRKGTAAAVLEL
ncbi:NAD(P)H-dependent oxidoreductase [Dokdonia sinensis]|uniref:NAD(P)H-dependent oxidoreductase n=1 Tax=Dokdonia sinensis TaxID=2479847 RepID=A0A3M0G3D3_9FLAO|nr:NAD(P)H-dependent oxidoreductase [Dokdonia sinensis]RMB59491.1 NAD(P)H-dependent oxidoreductase [Dokdonia sinensis]